MIYTHVIFTYTEQQKCFVQESPGPLNSYSQLLPSAALDSALAPLPEGFSQ